MSIQQRLMVFATGKRGIDLNIIKQRQLLAEKYEKLQQQCITDRANQLSLAESFANTAKGRLHGQLADNYARLADAYGGLARGILDAHNQQQSASKKRIERYSNDIIKLHQQLAESNPEE